MDKWTWESRAEGESPDGRMDFPLPPRKDESLDT